MPLYVYECTHCHFQIKHSLEHSAGKRYTFPCPNCNENNQFDFVREMDPIKDWYSNIVRIKNLRQRKGDRLYTTAERPK